MSPLTRGLILALIVSLASALPAYPANHTSIPLLVDSVLVYQNTIYVAHNNTLTILDTKGNIQDKLTTDEPITSFDVTNNSNNTYLFIVTRRLLNIYLSTDLLFTYNLPRYCSVKNIAERSLLLIYCFAPTVKGAGATVFNYIDYGGDIISSFSTRYVLSRLVAAPGGMVIASTFPAGPQRIDNFEYLLFLDVDGIREIYNTSTQHLVTSLAVNDTTVYATSYNWTLFSVKTRQPMKTINPNGLALISNVAVNGDLLAYLSTNLNEPYIQFIDNDGNHLHHLTYTHPPDAWYNTFLFIADDGTVVVSVGNELALWIPVDT